MTRTSTPEKLIFPASGHVGVKETMSVYLGLEEARFSDLGVLPQGQNGQMLIAIRHLIANGSYWMSHFVWRGPLQKSLTKHFRSQRLADADLSQRVAKGESAVEFLMQQIEEIKCQVKQEPARDDTWIDFVLDPKVNVFSDLTATKALKALVALELFPDVRCRARQRLVTRARTLYEKHPRILDLLYLATLDLDRYPATTVSAGSLKYLIIADKGEMGVRAVREALALKLKPVTLYSMQDDAHSLQVRLTDDAGGLTIGLRGGFRESYAGYEQITNAIIHEFQFRFGPQWQEELSQAALYPGYGPLAENAAAIRHFRRHGIVFVGPMQDVVERAGDKREFRILAQKLDPKAVTPGLVMDASDATEIEHLVTHALERGEFLLPGRLKAANGGGGRGQAVVDSIEGLPAAIQKVLGEIRSYGWDPGVMFEQNISETIHLEVQILRDRYGQTRHFGMRDCTEQRASQKIQEEAPPALLNHHQDLKNKIQSLAVQIADHVGYVGAGTIELMFRKGSFYFLEMNTRIQVEHPVTEESHAIDRGGKLEPLNLIQWQIRIARGEPLNFEQSQIVQTHVAREYRINAESWNPHLKDSRDGKRGLFVPNAGVFEDIQLPDRAALMRQVSATISHLKDLKVRFDCGFEAGDLLVNKDPTFGKLIVAVDAERDSYEVLRLVSIEVLRSLQIQGKQVLPNGKVIKDSVFQTNIGDHIRILQEPVLVKHCAGDDDGRHVNWVIGALRQG